MRRRLATDRREFGTHAGFSLEATQLTRAATHGAGETREMHDRYPRPNGEKKV